MGSRLFSARYRAQQHLVTALRSVLYRANLELARDPYAVRLARMLDALGLDTVLDVGANIGQFGAGLRSCGFEGRILSFEPQSAALPALRRKASGDATWTIVPAAVGAEAGTASLGVSANSFSSSILPMSRAHTTVAPGSGYVDHETVTVRTIADIAAEYGIDPRRTFLKSDTQGYEGAVLDGAGDLIGQFAAVQVELSLVELYDGQPLAPEMVARLADAGLDLYAHEPGFGDRANGRMLQYDAVFVRRSLVTDYAG